MSAAAMRSGPLGEFGAHTTQHETVIKDHFDRSEPVQDISRNLRQVYDKLLE